jgi:hypothetical protein
MGRLLVNIVKVGGAEIQDPSPRGLGTVMESKPDISRCTFVSPAMSLAAYSVPEYKPAEEIDLSPFEYFLACP